MHRARDAIAPLLRNAAGSSGLAARPDGERGSKGFLFQQSAMQQPPAQAIHCAAPDLLFDDRATNVHQTPVLHAAWARALTVAAGEAAVEVLLRLRRRFDALAPV